MVRNLGYQRKSSGRHEDVQESFSGRPQPFSGRRGHMGTARYSAPGSTPCERPYLLLLLPLMDRAVRSGRQRMVVNLVISLLDVFPSCPRRCARPAARPGVLGTGDNTDSGAPLTPTARCCQVAINAGESLPRYGGNWALLDSVSDIG